MQGAKQKKHRRIKVATKTKGIQRVDNGYKIDKVFRGKRIQERGFESFVHAEAFLNSAVQRITEETTKGCQVSHTFDEAAAEYLSKNADKASLVSDVYHLKPVMPFIGHMQLSEIHNGSLQGFVKERKATTRKLKVSKSQCIEQPLKNKTVNLSLAIVRRILNLATEWRDENGAPWLASAPKIKLLPKSDARPPKTLHWPAQRKLMPCLPDHLAKMVLFALNTGVRDEVVCNLQWDWEVPVPQIGGNSIFVVPKEHVKGEEEHITARVLVCNDVAQSIIESMRGKHETHVFVYRRERITQTHSEPVMSYKPVETMNNTAWQNARLKAGLCDFHIHDLRHTVGERLREAEVAERTITDVLWHAGGTMTKHYSGAQVVEIFDALQKIKDDSNRPNVSLSSLIYEAKEKRLTQKSLKKA
jgi:integrase